MNKKEEKIRETIVYIFMKALGNKKFSEKTWKKIAKFNAKILNS